MPVVETTPITGTATSVFEDAPLLTHVGLEDNHRFQFNFDWSSLTILYLGDRKDCKSILAIPRETTNLVELTLGYSSSKDLHIGGGELIHLPRLERLSVHCTRLLNVFETPSLQQLKIYLGNDLGEARTTLDLLHRSGIKLNTFLLHSGLHAEVKEILRCMPEVDRLSLCIPDTVFKWLAETRVHRLRCRTLIVSGYGGRRGLKALHYMIARRNTPGDVTNLSSKEVMIRTPWVQEDQDLVANL